MVTRAVVLGLYLPLRHAKMLAALTPHSPVPSPARRTTGNQTSASHKLVPPVAVVGEPQRTPPPTRGSSKMYSQRFGIVQREVKGPTPKVVIVRAKPPKGQGAEHHLQRIQHSHQKHHAILASIKSIERDRLKTEWDQHNDCKFVDSLVKARVKDAMQGFIINTEERRNK